MQFEKPKLQAISVSREDDFAERLERARQAKIASDKVIEARPVQVVEAPKPVEATPEPPPDHSKPFAHDNKNRFRRL